MGVGTGAVTIARSCATPNQSRPNDFSSAWNDSSCRVLTFVGGTRAEGMPIDNAANYRTWAAECLMHAANTSDQIAKDSFLERAQTWMRMADEADGKASRATQQQQQVQPKAAGRG